MMSFKEFRDIISYPPRFLFAPTLENYRETLFGAAGTLQARQILDATLNNDYTLGYLMTGVDPPRGWVMQWVAERFGDAAPQAAD